MPALIAQGSTDRYKVHFVEYISLHGKDHHALYVETDCNDKMGYQYHVTGNLLMGMKLRIQDCPNPETAPSFKAMTMIGYVGRQSLTQLEETCLSVPPPKPQIYLNSRRIYPHEPLRTCQEWIADVIEKLRRDKVITSPESGTVQAG